MRQGFAARGGRLGREVRGRHGGRHRGLRRGIDGDGELDVAAEFLGQGLGDQGPQPGLELLLDELVRGRDQGGIFHQPERPGEFQPGALMRLDLKIGQPVEGSCPHVCQVRIRHLCAPLAPHAASDGLTIHRSIHMLCTWHPRCTQ